VPASSRARHASGPSESNPLGASSELAPGPCVVAQGLRHVFPDGTVALDSIDLEIARGSFVAIVGPSGCGKSTLLRLISGLEQPSKGRLWVAGRDETASRERSDLRVGFVFQDAHLLPWRTVLENVILPLELRRTPPGEARQRALAAIADVELTEAVSRFPDELSGGMRMRVSIARALATAPELLLLDEPFAALDELTRQRLDERLRKLWSEHGMTVLFVTHSLSEAVFLADRALVMSRRPGRVVLDHPVELPGERSGWLRTEVSFARQTAVLLEALQKYGSVEEARS
jgi:NitT/TauT family transport system ATP-binding protein